MEPPRISAFTLTFANSSEVSRVAVQLAEQGGPLAVDLAHHGGHLFRHQHGQQHAHHGDQRELPAVKEHDRHGAGQGHHAADQRAEALGHGHGDVLHVVGHAAHDVAAGVRVEVGDRQVVDLVEQVVPHPPHDALAQARRQQRLRKSRADVDEKDSEQRERKLIQQVPRLVLDRIDRAALHGGRGKRQKRYGDHGDQHARQQFFLAAEIGQQALHGALHVFRLFHFVAHAPAGASLRPSGAEVDPGRGGLLHGLLKGGLHGIGALFKALRQGVRLDVCHYAAPPSRNCER